MKTVRYKSALNVILCLIGLTTMAQLEDNIDKNEIKKSYFLTELNYISDAVFMGRKDSVSAPYLYPSVLYHHKSGFYAKGSVSYLTKPDESRIDLYLLSSGFDFKSNHWFGDFSVTKYFFNEDSYNVISEVEADLTANLIYDLELVNIGLATSLYVNKNSKSDFFMSAELSHDFITSTNSFQFSPALSIHFGSQNFYQEYYNNARSGSGNGAMSGNPLNTNTTIRIEENEKFNLMAIEFSAPVWYNYKAASFYFWPTFVVPQSASKLVIDEIIIEEQLDETFYWIVGLSYTF